MPGEGSDGWGGFLRLELDIPSGEGDETVAGSIAFTGFTDA